MCKNTIKIKQTKNGILTKCNSCNLYNLTFNNILFEFTKTEFESFKNYINNLEIEYWEDKYCKKNISRKIPIHTVQQNLLLIFSYNEINDLKSLIQESTSNNYKLISLKRIDYKINLN